MSAAGLLGAMEGILKDHATGEPSRSLAIAAVARDADIVKARPAGSNCPLTTHQPLMPRDGRCGHATAAAAALRSLLLLTIAAWSSCLWQNIKRSAQKPERFGRIEPLKEPFIGAWMATSPKCKKMTTQELMEHQQMVQALCSHRAASTVDHERPRSVYGRPCLARLVLPPELPL